MYFCSISSGSSGNCFFVCSDRTNILVDAGISQKTLVNTLTSIKINPRSIDGILITHEHLDHYKGLCTISKNLNIPVYLKELTYRSIKDKLEGVKLLNIIENDKFSIGDLDINAFKLPHDAADPVGYSVLNGGKKISIVTDIGYISEEIYDNINDSDVVLLESNYNEEMLKLSAYPNFLKERILSKYGHLSNEDCAFGIVRLAQSSFKRIILGHLSVNSNFPELAYKTAERIIEKHGLKIGRDLKLTIAHRTLPSNYMRI